MKFDRDIVEGKLLNIHEALVRIEHASAQRGTYSDQDIDDLHVLHLQRAIQAAIDVANHLIAANRWEAPRNSSEAFEIIARNGALPRSMVDVLKKMVGFRNVAVHRYGVLDMQIVHTVIAEHLDDLVHFLDAMRQLDHSSEEE